jgi:uncharacterized protein YaaN involved in tellurite resistance
MSDDLQPQDLAPQAAAAAQQAAAVIPAGQSATLAVMTTDPEHLPDVQMEKAKAIAAAFDIEKASAIVDFGSAAQKGIGEFSAGLLDNVRAKDTGYVGDILTNLMLKVKEADVDGITAEGALANLPIIGPLFDAMRHWAAKFEKVNAQIETIEDQLDAAQRSLTKDVVMFDQLFAQNKKFFDDLNVYIAAGEMKLEELRTTTLPEFQAHAQQTQDPMDAQRVQDLQSLIERFDKKVHNLKLSRTIAIQTAPQIRIIQANNQVLVDKIQSSIMTTLPLWRSQIVIGVGLARQKRALEMQQQVDETTNELLSKNSEMLKQGSIEIAKQNERGIVDIETLRKVNADLITTIDETLRIQKEGREKRAAVESELAVLEKDLREKVVQAANS